LRVNVIAFDDEDGAGVVGKHPCANRPAMLPPNTQAVSNSTVVCTGGSVRVR
jgi:hypothetical protein